MALFEVVVFVRFCVGLVRFTEGVVGVVMIVTTLLL